MSWGVRITVLYLGFVAIILTLVFTCFRHKTDLEYKDYYAREIRFQEQIDAATNASMLAQPISYKIMDRAVQIRLPKELVTDRMAGTVYFMRPSDLSKDKTIPLVTDENGVQLIDPGFVKGVYKMQISFTSNGKNYFQEAVINFN